jgi:hypothetical protein
VLNGSLDAMSNPSSRLAARLRPRLRVSALVLVGAGLATTLVGCSQAVPMQPAAGANDPACAQVTVHLPEVVDDGQGRRETDAQATGAWGSPTSVLLHCGIETPAVSDLPCYDIQGVDWLVDQDPDDAETSILTTYGREPGVQVIVDTTKANGGNVLRDLADAVGYLPNDGKKCVGAGDLPGSAGSADEPTATPTPTP